MEIFASHGIDRIARVLNDNASYKRNRAFKDALGGTVKEIQPARTDRNRTRVTEVCFAVGCSPLVTFRTPFTDLVGVPPRTCRRHGARRRGADRRGLKQVTRPVRNREARVAEPQLASSP